MTEAERKKELAKLIKEQKKDMDSYHILPERIGKTRRYILSVDPHILDTRQP